MKRRIVVEIEGDELASWSGLGRVLNQVEAAANQPDPCPTCDGAGCDRCLGTGRLHLAKLTISPNTDGRAVIELWQGAPGSWWPMAATPTGKDLPAVGIDGLLACLQTGGLIVDDRR